MVSKIIKGTGKKNASESVGLADETGGVVHKRVVDAKEQARKLLCEVEDEAKKIKGEAEKIKSDAKMDAEAAVKKGFQEGESKGLAQVTEKLIALEKLKGKFYSDAEPEVIKLSMAVAEKVIGRLASESSDLIKNVVKQAIDKTLGDRIVVRINPEDYKNIMESETDFKERLDRTKRLTFREDESITRGGCVVESEVGTIDARLEVQLAAIKKALEI